VTMGRGSAGVPVSAWRMEDLLNQTEPLGKDDIFERCRTPGVSRKLLMLVGCLVGSSEQV
jgi:hypothetical protein